MLVVVVVDMLELRIRLHNPMAKMTQIYVKLYAGNGSLAWASTRLAIKAGAASRLTITRPFRKGICFQSFLLF